LPPNDFAIGLRLESPERAPMAWACAGMRGRYQIARAPLANRDVDLIVGAEHTNIKLATRRGEIREVEPFLFQTH